MRVAGAMFVAPRSEADGHVVAVLCFEGNRRDLLGRPDSQVFYGAMTQARRLVQLPVAPAPAGVIAPVARQAPAPSPAGAFTVC
jgi:hypothetical protein